MIYDSSTGLYYMNARYYDWEIGRFISQDTYRGEKNDAGTWHLYAYCANDPINYVDLSGHKQYSKYALKGRLKAPLSKLICTVAKYSSKVISGIESGVRKVPWIGKKLASKIPKQKLMSIITGATASATVNNFLELIVNNITAFLSVGGIVAGIFDWKTDGKLNNKVVIDL